jgi:hypothetical protein
MVSHRMGDQNLICQAPPCFGKHVKPLVGCICSRHHPLQFQGGLTSGRRPVVKIIAESLSHDERHVVSTPLSGDFSGASSGQVAKRLFLHRYNSSRRSTCSSTFLTSQTHTWRSSITLLCSYFYGVVLLFSFFFHFYFYMN